MQRYGISLQTGIKDRHNSNLLGEHPHMVRDGCYNITHEFGVHARTLIDVYIKHMNLLAIRR